MFPDVPTAAQLRAPAAFEASTGPWRLVLLMALSNGREELVQAARVDRDAEAIPQMLTAARETISNQRMIVALLRTAEARMAAVLEAVSLPAPRSEGLVRARPSGASSRSR